MQIHIIIIIILLYNMFTCLSCLDCIDLRARNQHDLYVRLQNNTSDRMVIRNSNLNEVNYHSQM